jgi:signal transduction histidine kinase
VVGAGIAAMHYVGLAAVRTMPPVDYEPLLLFASWLFAAGAAIMALAVVFLRGRSLGHWQKLACAGVMGLAIAGMHYTGMGAVQYLPVRVSPGADGDIDGIGLALAVAAGTMMILAAAIIVSIYDRHLAAQQERTADRLRQEHAALEERVAQRTQELQELSEELARSNAELERFAYIVSHDLKEPLRSITGFSGLLQRKLGPELEPDVKQYLEFIVDGARHMQALIDGLLDYARAGVAQEPMRSVELDQLLPRVLAQMAVSIHETGADVVVESLPAVQGDPLRLAQLFQNLIGNALKFRGDAPPRVQIRSEDIGSRWQFAVSDNGIGFDPRHRQRIFEVFQRLHGREDYSGTGIGLAICKKIVESHGGRIRVESEPGRGTTFFFTLPKVASETAATKPARAT